MPSYWLIAAGITALYLIVAKARTELRHRRRAQTLGCRPAFLRRSRLPLDVDQFYEIYRLQQTHDFLAFELALHRQLGRATWLTVNFGRRIFVTFDPENVAAMHAAQFSEFLIAPCREKAWKPLIGPGIFTIDGQGWQHSRAFLRPQFARVQFSRLAIQETHVQHLLDRLEPDTGGWTKTADLVPLFFNLTLDSATEFFFGQSIDSQVCAAKKLAMQSGGEDADVDMPEHDWSTFGQSFHDAQEMVIYRTLLMGFYWLCTSKTFRENCAEVQRFAEFCVQRALVRNPVKTVGTDNDRESDDKNSSGGKYVFLHELVKTTRNPKVLSSQLLNILLAARDTTADLLGWVMHCLSYHPDIYARLRQEVLANFGAYSPDETAHISLKALQSSTYLQHVLAETLRLHPPIPRNMRYTARDTTLPRGGGPDGQSPVYVRQGDLVIFGAHITHRLPDIWGDDADEFRPDRWQGRKTGWEYYPFGGGPRICLGKEFALAEVGYVVVRLAQRYDGLQNMDPKTANKTRVDITASPVNVLLRMHEAR